MTIQQFIEKAIGGGYLHQASYRPSSRLVVFEPEDYVKETRTIEQVFLDPLAWKAVGRALGVPASNLWAAQMAKEMMVALFAGSTIEEYLATL